jgi:hypothetical protein
MMNHLRQGCLAALVGVLVGAGAAGAAAFGVDQIVLLSFENRLGGVVESYSFEIEVMGSGLETVTVTPPGGAAIQIPMEVAGDFFFESVHYPTLVALNGAFPQGAYSFTLAGGGQSISGTLGYARSPTQGFIAIDAPMNHAVLGPFPTFTVTNGCTNCIFFIGEIDDLPTIGDVVERETPFGSWSPTLSVPTALTLSDMSDGTPLASGLPEGSYEFLANGISGTLLTDETLTGDSSGIQFDYGYGNSASNRIEFTVPEPASLALGGAAAAALVVLALADAGWRRRGRRA